MVTRVSRAKANMLLKLFAHEFLTCQDGHPSYTLDVFQMKQAERG